jgi:hypothetical protein
MNMVHSIFLSPALELLYVYILAIIREEDVEPYVWRFEGLICCYDWTELSIDPKKRI